MLSDQGAEELKGKTIKHFEDAYGNELEGLTMLSDLVIVFTDGSKMKLTTDWRGNDCYFSQEHIEKEKKYLKINL